MSLGCGRNPLRGAMFFREGWSEALGHGPARAGAEQQGSDQAPWRDDLGIRLTEISLLAGIAESRESPHERLAAALRQASKVAREISAMTDGIVWSVDPQNDSLQRGE